MTTRDEFFGLHLDEKTKDALRAEAEKLGTSVSALSSETLRSMLLAHGYEVEPNEPNKREVA